MKADIIIRNAHIVTMNNSCEVIKNGAVIIVGNKIADIGESSIANSYKANKEIDAKGNVVMPGLINSHTHASMTIFRGMADDMPLHEWLNNYIFPAEAKFLTAENVRLGALLACHEMIRSGTTCFADMYYFTDEVAQVSKQTGIRCLLSEALIDFPVPNNPTPQHSLDYTNFLLDKYKGDSLVNIGVGPHSPYTCSPNWLKEGRKLANQHDIPFHIHLAETQLEYDETMTKIGCTPVKNLENLGLLDGKTIAAHSIHVSDVDIEIMKRNNVSPVNNPQSNMKLVSGVCPVPKFIDAGCNVALGTDGVVSNNSLDMFSEMKVAALVHKLHNNNPAVASAHDVLKMATINGAKALGIENITGSIEKGKRADIIMIDCKQAHAQPMYNVFSQLVYSINGHDVDTVICDGEIVMSNKQVKNINLDDAIVQLGSLATNVEKTLNIKAL